MTPRRRPSLADNPRAAEILDRLQRIAAARRSIETVKADPALRKAVQAVCQAAGCQW